MFLNFLFSLSNYSKYLGRTRHFLLRESRHVCNFLTVRRIASEFNRYTLDMDLAILSYEVTLLIVIVGLCQRAM